MNELKKILIQHTPMIHFQADQAGATLRATELKPKLDRYLISKREGGFAAMPDGWKVGMGKLGQEALDYKVLITPLSQLAPYHLDGFGLYFAEIGKKDRSRLNASIVETQKRGDIERKLSLRIVGWDQDMLDFIEEHLGGFFMSHNFGTRQSKGFGSFSLEGQQEAPAGTRSFTVPTTDFEDLFDSINIFYKTLRSGINGIQRVGSNGGYVPGAEFYMKPLIFAYAQSQGIQWEKKSIKQAYFPNAQRAKGVSQTLEKQQAQHPVAPNQQQDYPLYYAGERKIVRDVLGLSSEQSWKGYNGEAKITKEECKPNGEVKRDPDIMRFKSPITFKPVFEPAQRRFRVYLITEETIPQNYLNSYFAIKNDGAGDLALPMWSDFSLDAFLTFAFAQGQMPRMVLTQPASRRAERLYGEIQRIYNELR